jgi:hypothetical protein
LRGKVGPVPHYSPRLAPVRLRSSPVHTHNLLLVVVRRVILFIVSLLLGNLGVLILLILILLWLLDLGCGEAMAMSVGPFRVK